MTVPWLCLGVLAASSVSAREADPGAYARPEKDTVINEKTDLVVSKLFRLSHPDFEIAHAFVVNHDPWNRDKTRVAFYENNGRGAIWGYVEELKKWQTKEEYLNASHPIMDGYVYRTFPAESIHWSPFEGEESVLYGINTTTNKVVRIDVDRPAGQQVTEIASYALDQAGATEAERSGNTSDTYGAGWTKDNRFTVVYVDKKGTTHGGVFLDVQKRSATYFDKIPAFTRKPAKPSDNEAWRGFPHRSSQHGGRSPSGKYMAIYAGSMNEGGDGVVNTYDGSFIKDGEVNFGNPASPVYPYNAMYVSWRADDAWFIVTSLGDSECRLVDGKRRWINLEKGEKPALWPNGIFQVYADTAAGVCRYRKLLTYYTTGHWTNTYKTGPSAGKSFSDSNYHAHGIPALRNDGRQLVYCAHENNYSTTDLAHAAAAGIDTAYMQGRVSGIGLFLVELKTAGE